MHLTLLSGAMYRIKLLSLAFSYTIRLDESYAKGICHVFGQLNKTLSDPPFGAAVWGTVQGRIAVNGIFLSITI